MTSACVARGGTRQLPFRIWRLGGSAVNGCTWNASAKSRLPSAHTSTLAPIVWPRCRSSISGARFMAVALLRGGAGRAVSTGRSRGGQRARGSWRTAGLKLGCPAPGRRVRPLTHLARGGGTVESTGGGGSKVTQLTDAPLIHEHVLQLEVAMRNRGRLRVQGAAGVGRAVPDERALRAELEQQQVLLAPARPARHRGEEPHNVRVGRQLGEQLALAACQLRRVSILRQHALDGVELARLGVSRQVHECEAALCQRRLVHQHWVPGKRHQLAPRRGIASSAAGALSQMPGLGELRLGQVLRLADDGAAPVERGAEAAQQRHRRRSAVVPAADTARRRPTSL
eukprot:scaffold24645_cov101-Isochrysis_galbana.AAC.3